MSKQRIIFAGTPEFAATALQALIDAGYPVCAVYTQPDRPAGRGRKIQHSAVKALALESGLTIYQPTSLKQAEAQAELAALQADLMVVAAYGLILPQMVLDAPRLGCINIHASLLPRWRGAAPIQRALLAGDTHTGISIMQMDAGLDTGAILLKNECPIERHDTAQTLHDRLAVMGAGSLLQALENFDSLMPEKQDERLAVYAHKLEKAEAGLDWNKPAEELERMVRAFNPWPVAHGNVGGLALRVWRAEALAEASRLEPGSILRANKSALDIATGAGVLRLLEVQKAGGRRIGVADLINAHPGLAVS